MPKEFFRSLLCQGGRSSWQAVDKVRQRRSRGAQRLNVRQRVRLASSLAAALLASLSEQPANDIERACEYPGLTFRHAQVVCQHPAGDVGWGRIDSGM